VTAKRPGSLKPRARARKANPARSAQAARGSLRDLFAIPPDERWRRIAALTPGERDALWFDWRFWARPDQLPPPGDWIYWLILAGRGAGKTRAGAEAVREWIKTFPIVNLIGPTSDDARDVMVLGESGILACCPAAERPLYARASARLCWPNGATSQLFSAEEPDRLRGKQHMKLWCDELAAWRRSDAFEQALLGLRLGDCPQVVITTTPRPIKIIRQLLEDKDAIVTRGATFDNADHLAQAFLERIAARYEGRAIGRQELFAELLEEAPGALWTRIDRAPPRRGKRGAGRICRDRRRGRSASDIRRARRRMRHCRRGQGGQRRNLCARRPVEPG
jgi:phage terminase large subunit-like protein